MVKIGDFDESILALVDHGSEVQLYLKEFVSKRQVAKLIWIMGGGFELPTHKLALFMVHARMLR